MAAGTSWPDGARARLATVQGIVVRFPFLLGLTPRVIIAFVLFGLAILASVGALSFFNGRAALEGATIQSLTELATEKETIVDRWFARKLAKAQLLAASPDLTTQFALVTTSKNSDEVATARDKLGTFLTQSWVEQSGIFSSIFALDAHSAQILVATDPLDVGKFKEDRPYFINGLHGPFIQGPFFSLPEGGTSIVFSAPIRTPDGQVLGVVAARVSMAELNALITNGQGRAYGTDDNYIVNNAGLYVTQPRFLLDPAPLRFSTQSDYLKRCLAGANGSALADDYRAEPVIAIYRWMATRGFCLIVKVDQSQAFASIITFRNAILLIGIIALGVASLTAILLARSITRPIKELRAGAERIGRGERNIRLPEGSRDELGGLARALNQMETSLAGTEAELRQRADELKSANAKLAHANAELEHENAERRRAEIQVRALNDGLEQRVIDRTAEIAAVNRELETFSYSVSHDLRAPLRHMAGFSQALLEDYGPALDTTAKDYISRIITGSVHMGRLIDELLTLSRVSRGELEREDVDLSALATDIVRRHSSAEPDRTITVAITPNMSAQADARLIELVLQNLLGNAWKFTGKNPDAEIAFGRTERNGRMVFFVRDNGVGFDMAYVGKLFAPFQRLHTTVEFEGTGIGLATVARIVHRHDGEISIDSAVGSGTTVYFTVEGLRRTP